MKKGILFVLILSIMEAQSQTQFVVHKANTRGHSDYGWLKANYSFSFASYYNPERMGFGKLLVLNDDYIDGGKGFGTHPHDNMEIVTIPLFGALEHKDSKGNQGVINAGDVQIMSAGTGIRHSEYNASKTVQANTLQTWILPEKENIEPRYEQKTIDTSSYKNVLKAVVSPHLDGTLKINQKAVYTVGMLDKGSNKTYNIHFNGNGVYCFVIKGKASIEGQSLSDRDAIGIWNTKTITIAADEPLHVLLIEVPMQ